MAEQRIKYMGSSDVHTLEKGEDFDGRLSKGLSKELTFDKSNRWVVDVDGLDSEAVALILEQPEFKDVTDMARVPSNLHQTTFLGHKSSEEVKPADDEANVSGGDNAGGETTVGGSTAGARRRGGAAGG